MDKKLSDELYGQILKSANRIKAEIMAENEDLIAFGDERLDTPELTLPHPRAHLRDFVIGPMKELKIPVDKTRRK